MAAGLGSSTEQAGLPAPGGQHEDHREGCHAQLTALSVHPGLGCVMAAAICLVGINAIFTGGDCHPAVLQNWSFAGECQSQVATSVGRMGTSISWNHSLCLHGPMASAYYQSRCLTHPSGDKPLQGSQDASNWQFGFLVGTFCFEIVPYYVAQASLSLSSAGKLICHHA